MNYRNPWVDEGIRKSLGGRVDSRYKHVEQDVVPHLKALVEEFSLAQVLCAVQMIAKDKGQPTRRIEGLDEREIPEELLKAYIKEFSLEAVLDALALIRKEHHDEF